MKKGTRLVTSKSISRFTYTSVTPHNPSSKVSSASNRLLLKSCFFSSKIIFRRIFAFLDFIVTREKPGDSYLEDLDQAEGCYRHIQKIFDQLEEFR